MTVQSVLFARKDDNGQRLWTPSKARRWLAKHDFRYDDIDVKPDHLRFRQHDPAQFKHFIMRASSGTAGVKYIIAW